MDKRKLRYLAGVQCTGEIHIGNILSVVIPTINLVEDNDKETLAFIADLHSLTTVKTKEQVNDNCFYTAAVWLACGLNPEKAFFYRQSYINGICELAWELCCLTPYPMLANAHAFKDKSSNLADVNVGLFTYPVLMTADIISVDADYVIVGKDQRQHIEIARDLTKFYNRLNPPKARVLPQAYIVKNTGLLPGIDGRKMSKSYKNGIDIFAEDEVLDKQIFSIQTDCKREKESKNPDECIIFKLYKAIAEEKDVEEMHEKYIRGAIGYKHAKEILLETIKYKFKSARKEFEKLKNSRDYVEEILKKGSEKIQSLIIK